MKITIAGIGYVGLSLATLFSQEHEVIALDVVPEKVKLVNQRISPIHDEYIEKYLTEKPLNLVATLNHKTALENADFIIICTPTDYDDKTNHFNTSNVEDIIEKSLKINPRATIVIKSTVPVGYVEKIRTKYNNNNIFFSPEFLREGKALYDNLYPSRIIIGDTTPIAHEFGKLLKSFALNDPPILYMPPTEAEAIKLFANTYLALRVAFFNELDTYAEIKNLNANDIIRGISLDPRIGNYYNNPSFGYGGYCLPKDTKQLLANYKGVPQDLVEAIIKANHTRKTYITKVILSQQPQTVGIYRLTMKAGSDNFRFSAIQDIIEQLESHNINTIIFEPTLNASTFNNHLIINDINKFAKQSDIILANRIDDSIKKFNEKIYSRDLFRRD